ncbi:ABC transporter ATP-binding protein [Paenibacillus sp. sgz500958]|uniref:ABC transporter ATP-binding protein n=1 Tax=Paenibacillus sp. sgz500958 TaxID=3242475 RepID=UPI0036D279A4
MTLEHVVYHYPGLPENPVIPGVSLTAARGEFISLVGPSGCGKTTLFRLIAGLLEPSGGNIRITGCESGRLGHVSLMPQQDLLLPWRTILGNCLLPWELNSSGRKEDKIREIRALLEEFGLSGCESAYPHELSGGMRQRAAFLRTVLSGGELMLLDEPFGALDAITKREMQKWLLRLWSSLGRTVLFITHDLEEALLLSDRIYLMGRSPGQGLTEVNTGLPRPRSDAMRYEPRFTALRKQLEERLHEADR